MKTAIKINYDYQYWFGVHFRDRYGNKAAQLYREMSEWLESALEISDYSVNQVTLKNMRLTRRYQIDFRTEEAYSFFALCWDSRVDEYLDSYRMKR